MIERPNVHLYGLDLIRFFAAMLVLLNHFATYSTTEASITSDLERRAYWFLQMFEDIGATGVQIFFVVSGFVISMSAMQCSGGAGALRFGMARAMRLLPALWISSAISVMALLMAGFELGPLLDRFVRSAILSPIGPYIDGVVWSLVVEAVFYLLIGVAILYSSTLQLVTIAILLGGISSIYLATALAAVMSENEPLIALLSRFPFKVFLLKHGVFFAIGILLWARFTSGTGRAVQLALVLFVLMGLVEVWLQSYPNGSRSLASVVIWLVALGCLILSIRSSEVPRQHKMRRLLGDMSYPIYLNHYTTGMVAVFLLHQMGVTGLPSFIVSLLIVASISFGVLWAERKVREWLRPQFSRIQSQSSQSG